MYLGIWDGDYYTIWFARTQILSLFDLLKRGGVDRMKTLLESIRLDRLLQELFSWTKTTGLKYITGKDNDQTNLSQGKKLAHGRQLIGQGSRMRLGVTAKVGRI